VPAVVGLPPTAERAEDPVLLLILGGVSMHFRPPNELPAEHFWAKGHPVVSFSFRSMPGDLHDYRDLVLEGPDPTLGFIRQAQAVIDACVEKGYARRDRVVVAGISRFGYLALRLAAAGPDLRHVGAFSPVTDWAALSEFAGAEDDPAVEAMKLEHFADELAGKRIYMAIGNHDERVSTLACTRFFVALNEANEKQGFGRALVDLYLTTSPGHTCADEWYELGMQRLLKAIDE
jgi:dienelactone hydrolase